MQKRIAIISGLCLSLGLLATQASCQSEQEQAAESAGAGAM